MKLHSYQIKEALNDKRWQEIASTMFDYFKDKTILHVAKQFSVPSIIYGHGYSHSVTIATDVYKYVWNDGIGFASYLADFDQPGFLVFMPFDSE